MIQINTVKEETTFFIYLPLETTQESNNYPNATAIGLHLVHNSNSFVISPLTIVHT